MDFRDRSLRWRPRLRIQRRAVSSKPEPASVLSLLRASFCAAVFWSSSFSLTTIKAFRVAPEKPFVLPERDCKIDIVEEPREEKRLETTSFIVHATRGVIRDQKTRRKAMAFLLGLAVLLLISGLTFLAPMLNPHEHPWLVILFWIVCVWLTFTATLLALFDLLMLRLEARRAERALREKLKSSE